MRNKFFISLCLAISIPASSYACARRAFEVEPRTENQSFIPFLLSLALIDNSECIIIEASAVVDDTCKDAEISWQTDFGTIVQLSNRVAKLIPDPAHTHHTITASDPNIPGCGNVIVVRVIPVTKNPRITK